DARRAGSPRMTAGRPTTALRIDGQVLQPELPPLDRRDWMIALRRAVMVCMTTRLLVFLVGYLAVATVGYVPEKAPADLDDLGPTPVRHFDSELLNLPYRWDAGWYVGIAMKGYEYDAGYGPLRMQRIVFFPAFPMAIRLLARPFGRHALPFFIAGTIV